MNDLEFFRRIRKMIGRHSRHLGRRCLLIEVLSDEAVLVLRYQDGSPLIQGDQFGHAVRRTAEIVEVPVFTGQGREQLSDEVLELLSAFENRAA